MKLSPNVSAARVGWTGVILLLAAMSTAACASAGGRPHPFPMPGSSAGGAAPPSVPYVPLVPAPDTYALVGTALGLRGAPYKDGGTGPSGFDCSGFIQYVFAQHGVALPREVRDQFQVGQDVNPDDVEAGDLVFFSTVSPGPSHVGIAVGGDQFVHAPSTNGVVRVEHLSSSYWSQRLIAIRRVR